MGGVGGHQVVKLYITLQLGPRTCKSKLRRRSKVACLILRLNWCCDAIFGALSLPLPTPTVVPRMMYTKRVA